MIVAGGITELVRVAIEERASDLHLSAGVPPVIRVFGAIRPPGRV